MASRVSGTRPVVGRNRIRFAPESQTDLLAGVETLEHILGPTIGPHGHPVVFSKIGRPGALPERLLDGATIARRMTGLDDTFANVGLMLARQAAWTARSTGGDAPALSVVVMARALRSAARLTAAGVNQIALRRDMDRELESILAHVASHATLVEPADLLPLAGSFARDTDVADAVLRALSAVGPDGVVVAMESRGRAIDVEHIEGSLWETSAIIGPMQPDGRDGFAWLDDPAVLIWDAPLADVVAFASALDRIRSLGIQQLVVIARSFAKEVLGLIALNALPDFTVVPVETPHEGAEQAHAVEDIAALTGSPILRPEANDRLDQLAQESLGRARQIVIGRRMLNIQAETETSACEQRRAAIQEVLGMAADEGEERRLLTRLGRLQGGMAVIWVGAPTISARSDRLANIQRTLAGIRQVQRNGILPSLAGACLPGGCAGARDNVASAPGARVAWDAVLAPIWWLARNAGMDPSTSLASCLETGSLPQLDISLPVAELAEAIRIGLTTASLAISSDVIVHRPRSLNQTDLRP